MCLPFVYLCFLGTLESPLSRPFSGTAGRLALAATALALVALFIMRRERFIPDVVPTDYAAWDMVPGPWFLAYQGAVVLILFYSLLVAISAWRHAAPGTITRSRAKAYALAYVARDVMLAA